MFFSKFFKICHDLSFSLLNHLHELGTNPKRHSITKCINTLY